jgi:outer membrane protein TolC
MAAVRRVLSSLILSTVLLAACDSGAAQDVIQRAAVPMVTTGVAAPMDLAHVLVRIATQAPAVLAAQAEQRQAQAERRQAQAAWLGKVDAYARSVHYNDARLLQPITYPPNVALYPFARNQFDYGVEASLPIDISGQILAQVHGAEANAERARYALDDQRLRLLLQGAGLYRGLQALAGAQSALQEQVRALTQSERVARKGLKIGQTARIAVLRIEAARAAAEASLAGVEGQQAKVRAELAALMNEPRFDAAIVPVTTAPNWPMTAGAPPPALLAAQFGARAARAKAQAAWRAQLPQLAIVGGWDHNAAQFDHYPIQTWQVMALLRINLWSGGGQRAAIASARASADAAAQRADEASRNFEAARASAHAAWLAQQRAYAAAQAGVNAADSSARIERDRFRVGLGSVTELIDTEAARAQAHATLASTLAGWWSADDALRYANGEPPAAAAGTAAENYSGQYP